MKKLYDTSLPVILLFLLLTVVYFRKFFLGHLLPIPLDIITGVYYPWRDYGWGYSVAVPVKNALPSDIVSFIFPFRILAIDLLKSGKWPLWNPYVLSGTPLLANFQTALFYPTTLLYFITKDVMAWSISIVLQTFLSLLFMYLFLRQVILSKLASIFGAIIFSFSAFATIWLEYNTHGHVGYWLPFMLFSIERYRQSKKLVWLFAILLATVLQLFAGYPQMMLYSLIAVGLYIAVTYLLRPNSFSVKDMALVTGSLIMGLIASAVQTLPAIEAIHFSNRSVDTTVSSTNAGFLPLKNIVTFFIPDFFGNPTTLNYWGTGFYDNFAGYVGIATFIFVWYAYTAEAKQYRNLIAKIRRINNVQQLDLPWKSIYFSLLLILSLLLSLHSPLSSFLFRTNIGDLKAAVASRALFLTDFAYAGLAAIGLDWFISEGSKTVIVAWKLIRPQIYLIAIMVGIGMGVTVSRNYFLKRCLPYPADNGKAVSDCMLQFQNLAIAQHNMVLPIVILISVLCATLLYWKLRNLRLIFACLIIVVIGVDLFRYGDKYLSFTPERFLYPKTPAIQYVQNHASLSRISGGDAIPMNLWVPYQLSSSDGYDAYYSLRYAQFLAIMRGEKDLEALGRYGAIINYDSQLFDFLGIRYVFAQLYNDQGEVRPNGQVNYQLRNPKFTTAFTDKSVVVLQNLQSFPEAFLVPNVIVAASDKQTVQLLVDPTTDLRKLAIVSSQIAPLHGRSGTAVIVKTDPTSKSILTSADDTMLLVVSDSYYPGWQVLVDGVSRKIIRTNFDFRGVVVPGGNHLVVFSYQPQAFVTGSIISLASAIVVLGLGALLLLRPSLRRRML